MRSTILNNQKKTIMKRVYLLLIAIAGFLTACTDNAGTTASENKTDSAAAPAETKQERNKKILMASMEGMATHDAEILMKDAAPDYTDYGDGTVPPMKNPDSSKIGLKAWLNAFPDVKGENLVYAAEGDYVMVWGTWSATFKNDFMGIKATGKSYSLPDVDIFKFNDEGKITEHRNIQPFSVVMTAVGAKMPK
jgi:hypothetical protein